MWLFYTLFSLKLKWSCPSKTLVATHNLPKEPEYKFEGKKCGTKQMLQDMEKKINYYLSHRQQKTCEKVHYLPDKWDLSNDWEIYQGKSIQLTINKLYNSTIKGTFVFEKFLIILTPLTEEMYTWNWRATIKLYVTTQSTITYSVYSTMLVYTIAYNLNTNMINNLYNTWIENKKNSKKFHLYLHFPFL